jgi:hypothetical protein
MLWVTRQNIELCAISKGVHLSFFSMFQIMRLFINTILIEID